MAPGSYSLSLPSSHHGPSAAVSSFYTWCRQHLPMWPALNWRFSTPASAGPRLPQARTITPRPSLILSLYAGASRNLLQLLQMVEAFQIRNNESLGENQVSKSIPKMGNLSNLFSMCRE